MNSMEVFGTKSPPAAGPGEEFWSRFKDEANNMDCSVAVLHDDHESYVLIWPEDDGSLADFILHDGMTIIPEEKYLREHGTRIRLVAVSLNIYHPAGTPEHNPDQPEKVETDAIELKQAERIEYTTNTKPEALFSLLFNGW